MYTSLKIRLFTAEYTPLHRAHHSCTVSSKPNSKVQVEVVTEFATFDNFSHIFCSFVQESFRKKPQSIGWFFLQYCESVPKQKLLFWDKIIFFIFFEVFLKFFVWGLHCYFWGKIIIIFLGLVQKQFDGHGWFSMVFGGSPNFFVFNIFLSNVFSKIFLRYEFCLSFMIVNEN